MSYKLALLTKASYKIMGRCPNCKATLEYEECGGELWAKHRGNTSNPQGKEQVTFEVACNECGWAGFEDYNVDFGGHSNCEGQEIHNERPLEEDE